MGKTSNKTSTKQAVVKKKGGSSGGGGGGKSSDLPSHLRIMIAIAQQNRMGIETPERKKVMAMADIDNAGSFSTICGRMKKKGHIEFPDSKTIILTDEGKQEVEPHLPPAPKCNADYHEELKKKISRKKVKEMFDCLASGDGVDGCPLSELAKIAGMDVTSGSFKTYVGCLNPNVERFNCDTTGEKMIKLKDDCFPFGRGAD